LYGEIGNGSRSSALVPALVEGLKTGVTSVAAGTSHSCAVVNDSVLCWGRNADGQLGNNHTNDSTVPVQVLLE
jgi:alpha-tubulin suppressor-like RCC1 family protein